MAKADIRNKIFGSKFRLIPVKLDDTECFVRSPKFSERTDIINNAANIGTDGKVSKMDLNKLQVTAIIKLTLDAANEPVFSMDDMQLLLDTPVSEVYDELVNAVMKVLNMRKEDIEEVGKN